MLIRSEKQSDFAEIHSLVKVAFQTAKVSDGDEQDFVDRLRNGDSYLPELALLAEENARIIGHIMLSKTQVSDGQKEFDALLLAPLAVALEYRSKGIGAALVAEAFQRAKAMQYTAVFLVGDPAYYQRFGFRQATEYGIRCTLEIPEQYVLACELVPHALANMTGTVKIV